MHKGRHGPHAGLQQVHPQKHGGLGLLGPIWRQWPVTNGSDRSWRTRGCPGPFESAGDPALLVSQHLPPSTIFHSLPSSLLSWPQLWLSQLSFSFSCLRFSQDPGCTLGRVSAQGFWLGTQWPLSRTASLLAILSGWWAEPCFHGSHMGR